MFLFSIVIDEMYSRNVQQLRMSKATRSLIPFVAVEAQTDHVAQAKEHVAQAKEPTTTSKDTPPETTAQQRNDGTDDEPTPMQTEVRKRQRVRRMIWNCCRKAVLGLPHSHVQK